MWFHISHVLGTQSHLSCFIAYCIGNLIRNIIAKDENFLFKNISDIKMEYGLRCKEKFQWSCFSICFIYFFPPGWVYQGLIPLPHIKNCLAGPNCRVHCRLAAGCVAFFSKMHNSWYVFLPADSFDNICKTQTAPQFS